MSASAAPAGAQFVDRTVSSGLAWYQITWGAAFGDLDLDGDLDLVSGHHFYPPTIFWNDGSGIFDFSTHPQPWSGFTDRHGMLLVSVDQDEDLEIYVTHGADGGNGAEPKELYRNDGNGLIFGLLNAAGMSDPAGRSRSASAADFDGDGRVDIWVGKAPDPQSKNSLFRNAGTYAFTDVAAAAGLNEGLGTIGGVWGDADDDGDPDLLVGGEEFSRPTTLWRNDGGVFANASGAFSPALPVAASADWGDYDDDGDLDLAVAKGDVGLFDTFAEGDSVSYFFNSRFADSGIDGLTIPSPADTLFAFFRIRAFLDVSTTFLGPSGVHPVSPLAIPLTDEYVGAPAFTPGVDRGTFVWRTSPGGPWEIRCSTPDLNFDNFDGWITGHDPITGVLPHDLEDTGFTPGGVRVWRNDGGSFVERTAQLGLTTMLNPHDVSWVDFDNDGDLDLHVVDFGTSAAPNAPDRMYRNDGGAFTDVTAAENLAGSDFGMGDGGIWGDTDGDLDLDLYLQEGGGPISFSAFGPATFLVNEGSRGGALLLDLAGRASGRPAIGTRVQVVANGRTAHRRVEANSWRGYQDPRLVHVGLGSAVTADSVIVHWNSGYTQVFLSVPAGRWRIEEGTDITGAPRPPSRLESGWTLRGLAPQPARGAQRVLLTAKRDVRLEVTVHDVAGRRVRTIHRGALPPGAASIAWDGRDEGGSRVGAGVYWIRVSDGVAEESVKAVRIR